MFYALGYSSKQKLPKEIFLQGTYILMEEVTPTINIKEEVCQILVSIGEGNVF